MGGISISVRPGDFKIEDLFMNDTSRQAHWQEVYGTKGEREVSWFQEDPALSLELIALTGISAEAEIADIGGGASRLVDDLLKPAFRPEGTITAGNAPGLNTGAAAMVVADRAWADKNALEPMARLVAYGIGAVDPRMFGLGPIPAVKQALGRAGWKIGDIDRIEINEAFAAIVLAVTKDLGLSPDVVNVVTRSAPPALCSRRGSCTRCSAMGSTEASSRSASAADRESRWLSNG
jgi:hypothetical protein